MSNTSMRDDIVGRLMRWHDRECEITADCTTLRQAAETITALRQALRRALRAAVIDSVHHGDLAMTSLSERLRDRTTLRFMGDCKCGNCQLVPRPLLDEAIAATARLEGVARVSDERFAEIKRGQAIVDGLVAWRESLLTCPLTMEPAGRARIRELSTPPKDDHDRAVLALCDDIERLIKRMAATCDGKAAEPKADPLLNLETP